MTDINTELKNIQNSIHGKDVRQSTYHGIDAINDGTENTTARQIKLENEYSKQVENNISDNPSSAEDVAARTSNITGKTFDNIGKRMDDHDTHLGIIDSQMSDIATNLVKYNYSIKDNYGGTCFTCVHPAMPLLDSIIEEIKKYSLHMQIVVPVYITYSGSTTNLNTNSDCHFDENTIIDLATTIKKCQQNNIKIDMIKPHVMTKEELDSFNRSRCAPANNDDFFNNYTICLKELAQIAVNQAIPLFSIGCEMYWLTRPLMLNYWITLINTLKNLYTLMYTYAFTGSELNRESNNLNIQNDSIVKYLDIIGINFYPNVNLDNITYYSNSMENIYSNTRKNFIITETGSTNDDMVQQKLYYTNVLNAVGNIDFIVGIYVWCTLYGFNFIGTPSESIITKYFGGVLND